MNPRRKRIVAGLAGLSLAIGALASAVQAAPASRHKRISFVPATLVFGQGARVTLVNLDDPSNSRIPPDPCRILVRFFDAAGAPVGNLHSVDLGAGESQAVPGAAVDSNAQLHLRATILIPPDPVCIAVHANFEVFDTRSNATMFMNPGVIRGFNPQPDPPGFQFEN